MRLETHPPWGYIAGMHADAKATTLKRLGRIEGQVRGLARMVEGDRYCIDVVTQISAVRAALRKVEEEVLRDHVAHCVEGAIASGNKGDQRRKIAELMDVLGRAERCWRRKPKPRSRRAHDARRSPSSGSTMSRARLTACAS